MVYALVYSPVFCAFSAPAERFVFVLHDFLAERALHFHNYHLICRRHVLPEHVADASNGTLSVTLVPWYDVHVKMRYASARRFTLVVAYVIAVWFVLRVDFLFHLFYKTIKPCRFFGFHLEK